VIALLLLWPTLVRADVPDASEVLRVPDAMRQLLQTEVIGKARYPKQRLQRLTDFMFEPWGLGLTYDNSHSRTVTQTFADRRGNCLSFTLTFIELARLAGLDARMQEAELGQISSLDDRSLVYTGHVNVAVKLGRRSRTVDFDRNRALAPGDYNPVTRQRALAHYYNNRGVELMASGMPADAYFEHAVRLDPSMVAAHANRGVLHLLSGNPPRGLRHLHAALFLDPGNVSTLTNLITLHRSVGNTVQAVDYAQRLQSLHGTDPFRYFVIGLQLQRIGEHSQALNWFQKAARVDRRQPLFLFGMVRSLEALGQDEQARRKQARALALNRRLSIADQRIQSPASAAVTGLQIW
jgi:tetratricopeptide (TPR) repeat protein